MKVRYTDTAIAEIEELLSYVAQHDPMPLLPLPIRSRKPSIGSRVSR